MDPMIQIDQLNETFRMMRELMVNGVVTAAVMIIGIKIVRFYLWHRSIASLDKD